MKMNFKRIYFECCTLLLCTTCLADVSVTSVTAHQRYPWNGLVDIVVTMEGSADDVANVGCSFEAMNSATHAAVPITSITLKGADIGSGVIWIRRFIWDAVADVGCVKIADIVLAVDVKVLLRGVQLWENGPYWAECNVGANKPEEYGYYFWWGDTVGYKRNASNNGWVSVEDGTSFLFDPRNCPTYKKSEGYIDSTGNIVAAHDAATTHLGAPWRMPTALEIEALINNCDTVWTTRNGVWGRLVTGRGAYASKSIFLPAAGFGDLTCFDSAGLSGGYWSSTATEKLDFTSSNFYRHNSYSFYGLPVRPLRGFAK